VKNRIELKAWKHFASRISAILVGLVFLAAALSKMGDLNGFQKALEGYAYIPFWLQSIAVLLIPGIELTIGFHLLLGRNQREAGLIAVFLLLSFLALGIYDVVTGTGLSSCGCIKVPMPVGLELNGWGIIVRNLVFSFLAILSCYWAQTWKKTNHLTRRYFGIA
jgi:hypothetical protein